MRAYEIEPDEIKNFMRQLLLSDTFEPWSLFKGEVRVFCDFIIDGTWNGNWGEKNGAYIKWEQIRPYIVQIIKGKQTPDYMKLVLLRQDDSGTGYLNVFFEGQKLWLTTTYQPDEFVLDCSLEQEFCERTEGFLKKNHIPVILQK